MVDRVVLDYKDIHKDALDKGVQCPTAVPYFEGDYWPNVLEESIRVRAPTFCLFSDSKPFTMLSLNWSELFPESILMNLSFVY